MQKLLQGILLSKDRKGPSNIWGQLLLRSGKKLNVLFLGAIGKQGKLNGSSLEVGALYEVSLEQKEKAQSNTLVCGKEWRILWRYKNIRFSYKAFVDVCFLSKILNRSTLLTNLSDEVFLVEKQGEGHFKNFSLYLFFLEKSLKEEQALLPVYKSLFLSKMLKEEGILPRVSDCFYCQSALEKQCFKNFVFFDFENSCVICQECMTIHREKTFFKKSFFKLMHFFHDMEFSEVSQKGKDFIHFSQEYDKFIQGMIFYHIPQLRPFFAE